MAFLNTGASFSSLFGPLSARQDQFQPRIFGIGANLLGAAANASFARSAAANLSDAQLARLSPVDTVNLKFPTSLLPDPDESLNQRVREVRKLQNFIDANARDLDKLAQDTDRQATFVLFKAISNLKVLAEFAADEKTSASSLARLDEQFQSGLEEVREYLSVTELDKLDLFLGDKEYKVEATTRTGKNASEFNSSLVEDDPDAAITGITGTEVFTVSVTKSGTTDDIEVDLSGLSGTLSLNNIKDYINTQIEALTIDNGSGEQVPKHLTRFDIRRDTETGRYGFQIEGTITEEVKLSAAAAEATLFVASSVAQLDDSFAIRSRLTEFNSLSGTITRDNTTSFAGVDYAASEIAELVDAANVDEEDNELSEAVSALVSQFRADALEDVNPDADDEEDETENSLSITNVDAEFRVNADTTSSRVAVDSEGGIYVVGTSSGSFEHQLNAASGQDVFLSKFDTEGNVIFSRLLGVSGDAEVFGVTVDSNDNVIIVGQTDSELSTSDVIDTTDAFVAKYSKNGDEVFRYQLDKFAESAAVSVAVDSNDDIFIGGYTKGAISATSGFSGGEDALILKLSGSSGALLDSNVFGTSSNEVIKGIAVDSNDNLVVAVEAVGNAVVYRIDGTDLSNQTDSLNFGNLGTGGSIEGIAIDNANGQIYLSGVTTNGSLDASGAATVNESALGGLEGFVSSAALTGSTSLTAGFTTYISTAGTDKVADVVVNNGVVYVAGNTTSTLAGETSFGTTDSFVARINGSTGALENVEQYGEGLAAQTTGGLAFTNQGDSVLELLGLPTGTIQIDETLDIQTQTTAKVGDFFTLRFDGGQQRKITLQDGDTLDDIARKIRIAGFRRVDVDVTSTSEGDRIIISALDDGESLDLLPGTGGRDLLARLGIQPGKLLPKNDIFNLGNDDDEEDRDGTDPDNLGGSFALGIAGALNISDRSNAKFVVGLLETAATNTQRAFRSLTFNPIRALLLADKAPTGTASPATLARIANLQGGLARLQAGSGGGGFFI
ncbi:MAG: hypothetical protein COB37_02425 [Kordiimonadales bacterium]|nr:MAG: hypothetical protein COB37_02425 [Kordiimonadales bacterium]